MRASPVRVYADTSVYGGVHDDEFREFSEAFFERVRGGRYRLLTSPLVFAELQDAPQAVQDWYDQFEPLIEHVDVDAEALILRDAYLAARVVAARWAEDALHVALASVHNAELIVSWNFRHMVNYQRIRGYNAVNLLNGYREVDIRTPREVVGDEDDDEDV